jgi:hypothetical protein
LIPLYQYAFWLICCTDQSKLFNGCVIWLKKIQSLFGMEFDFIYHMVCFDVMMILNIFVIRSPTKEFLVFLQIDCLFGFIYLLQGVWRIEFSYTHHNMTNIRFLMYLWVTDMSAFTALIESNRTRLLIKIYQSIVTCYNLAENKFILRFEYFENFSRKSRLLLSQFVGQNLRYLFQVSCLHSKKLLQMTKYCDIMNSEYLYKKVLEWK